MLAALAFSISMQPRRPLGPTAFTRKGLKKHFVCLHAAAAAAFLSSLMEDFIENLIKSWRNCADCLIVADKSTKQTENIFKILYSSANICPKIFGSKFFV